MIALVDYGAGDLTSVRNALAAVALEVKMVSQPEDLAGAAGVVIAGEGNFQATTALGNAWREAVLELIGNGRPLLGLCLGMQWLFEGSEEAPECPGLGLMSGMCARLDSKSQDGTATLKVPHVGWNQLEITRRSPLLEGIADGVLVYFTHSYAAPITSDTAAVTAYGARFASAVERGQVWGVQFLPEKSGEVGLRILRNFATLAL